jgi:SRSO17 transposase
MVGRRIGMDVKDIRRMGKELDAFLSEFDDCFSRCEQRVHLGTYVRGQLSKLQRKSIEPMALAEGIKPRTLQWFLSDVPWDGPAMRDGLERMVARDHADPGAIGVIDESANPKQGRHTAGVARQWCGNKGQVCNCVVGVHLTYVVDDFQCILDSELFLPQEWVDDPVRRRQAGIPQDLMFRTKPTIALDLVRRAVKNGIRVMAWTFDELYGRGREFLDGMNDLGQNYVGEVPSDMEGWLRPPRVLRTPRPGELAMGRRPRIYPRLARKTLAPCEVRNLAVYSREFQNQPWERFRIKDGEKGPMVWEVKHSLFYRKHGERGLPGQAHTLIVARNVVNPKEIKYFVSNLVVGTAGVTMELLLRIAFSRWPIERCFELGKNELGMDHFEVRSWDGIHRHWFITQLTLLFCARVHQRLREKNGSRRIPDGGTGAPCRLDLGRGPISLSAGQDQDVSESRGRYRLLQKSEPVGQTVPPENDSPTPPSPGHLSESFEIMCAG